MILSRLQITVTLLIAILLHAGITVWFSLPDSQAMPKLKEKPPLQINLLATIAETNVNATPDVVKPPTPLVKKPQPAPVKPVLNKPKPPLPEAESEQVVESIQVVEPTPLVKPHQKPLNAIATARYEQLLLSWLEKHKQYPRRAKRLRIEGEGMLRILIDRRGQTQQVTLEQRTGNRLLDKAALEMAQRANPFPAMPANDPRQQLEFIVPVAFMLR